MSGCRLESLISLCLAGEISSLLVLATPISQSCLLSFLQMECSPLLSKVYNFASASSTHPANAAQIIHYNYLHLLTHKADWQSVPSVCYAHGSQTLTLCVTQWRLASGFV